MFDFGEQLPRLAEYAIGFGAASRLPVSFQFSMRASSATARARPIRMCKTRSSPSAPSIHPPRGSLVADVAMAISEALAARRGIGRIDRDERVKPWFQAFDLLDEYLSRIAGWRVLI